MGDGGEGCDKDGGNGAGAGCDLQGFRAVGVIVWYQELGGDDIHAKLLQRITSLGSKMDYRDNGAAYNVRRAGVAPGG